MAKAKINLIKSLLKNEKIVLIKLNKDENGIEVESNNLSKKELKNISALLFQSAYNLK
jgi:hypothetical protein